MQNTENQRRRLRTKDAAVYCGLSQSTFEKYRITGQGSAYHKLGRIVVYDTEDLDLWMAERRCRSTSDYLPEAT
jgi:predicted DNA-binding transcriptional regulator AlpA